MKYLEKYKLWCESNYFDNKIKKELLSIQNNKKEIKERFCKDLEFGTGGLRGLIGAGSNRMNIYTVRKATQGIANYINKFEQENKSVVIAYDSRNMSKEFAKETALCFNANGIKTYLFTSLRPTPELSFAVKKIGCTAGIVITASHNSADYNGYKVYWKGAAQITPPLDKHLIDSINDIKDYDQIKTISENEAKNHNLYTLIDKEIDDSFIDCIKKINFSTEDLTEEKRKLKIVYTPLHGAGNIPVQRILKESGFSNVFVVKEQQDSNGNFPTVKYPNPEESSAFKLGINLAKEKNADIILATDPDADRLGIYAKNVNDDYICFNGNMIACLMADYILSQLKIKNSIPQKGVIVKTIVTTNMLKAIANNYNVATEEVLTGFKYIGEKINQYEKENSYKYIFGAEESYGYLADTYVRDKDAVSSVKLLCEMAAYYKKQNKTLCDVMEELYKKHGYYKESLFYINLESDKITKIMSNVRHNLPETIGNERIFSIKDYLVSKEYIIKEHCEKPIFLNKSNVLYFNFKNNGFCCLRPSGTEPKIKFYISVKDDTKAAAEERLTNIKNGIKNTFKLIKK